MRFAVVLLLAATPALADPLASGAGFLVAHQGAFRAGEGRVVAEGWEWRVGSGEGAANVSGIAALALWEAAEKRGEKALSDAARERARIVRAVLSSGGSAYAPDLELLARVSREDVDGEGLLLVQRALDVRIRAAGSAEEEVRRLIAVRGANADLVGYDVAQLAEAALAADRGEVARELLSAVRAHDSEWRTKPRSTFGVVSSGALASAFLAAGERVAAEHEAAFLLGIQARDGSWHARETEATAYAVRALASIGRATGSRSAAAAAGRGRVWLEKTQLRSGAWADYNDGLPEPFVGEVFSSASAEALRALVAAG